jgi:hypothetical protein
MEMNGMIKYDDNFLSAEEHLKVIEHCLSCLYVYGESDDYGLPPTGMISQVQARDEIFDMFKTKLKEKCSLLKEMSFYRMYVNCFAPNENPYFHVDGKGLTFLYYASDVNWDVQDGGETQFHLDGNIYGVSPIPNRLVMFDGMILHRATTFRDRHRFTIAIKYGDEEVPVES